MNISMNTNQIADSQTVNRILYGYALKAQNTPQKEVQSEPDTSKADDIKLSSDNLLKNIDIDDIKKSAQSIGEEISEDDIKYGLTYGRSVLADYCA